MYFAIIDLGTNTFHLLIVEKNAHQTIPIYKAQIPTKIGKSGINQGIITEEATQRALTVLTQFRQKIDEWNIPTHHITAIGTSAVRNASNASAFCQAILEATGITVEVISGDREAELIYEGVKQAMHLEQSPSLVIDIGGGSVEFIICNQSRIFWKQSFEIGGQRLLEKFVATDPISASAIQRLSNYLEEALLPLLNAAHQYAPKTLVGSSGSFDTLVEMDFMNRLGHFPDAQQTDFELSLSEFERAYELITTKNRAQRLAIPGMIELRVDLIVPAVVLIAYVLKALQINRIRTSTYALKEGVLAWVLSKNQSLQ